MKQKAINDAIKAVGTVTVEDKAAVEKNHCGQRSFRSAG